MSTPANGLRGSQTQAQTRLLLSLWDLQGSNQEVKRSDLNKWLLRSKEKVGDYQDIFKDLQEDGAIQITTDRSVSISLTPKGLEILKEGLKNPEFQFDGPTMGVKLPNALLKWMRSNKDSTPVSPQPTVESEPPKVAKISKIKNYAEFKKVVLKVHETLDKGYNLQNLVPIYRIRREIGDAVDRLEFNEWFIKMQEDEIFQLMTGEMPDMTPDKREDSLTLPGGAFRFYAKRL